MLKNARARAKKQGIPFDLELTDIVIPEVCPVLGIPLMVGEGKNCPNSPSLDKIIPEKGYVKGNVCVISFRANILKRDGLLWELELVTEYVRKMVSSSI